MRSHAPAAGRCTAKIGGLAMALAITSAPAFATTWEFNTPTAIGVAPSGWQDASQSISSPPPQYQVTTFGSGVTALRIETRANTSERPKIRTTTTCRSGTYTWRVYVPTLEAGSQTSLGAFLYSDQSGALNSDREIDFEIAYGSASERAANGIPAGALMCYMTVQRDDSSGTPFSSVVFQPANPANHIQPNAWYTLTLRLTPNANNRYVASWLIQRDGGAQLTGRPDFTCGYGPSGSRRTTFRIFCSLENLAFFGDHLPTVNQHVWFDRVTQTP